MSINELWVITAIEDGEEGLVTYPLGSDIIVAIDSTQKQDIIMDAQNCNDIWKKNLQVVRFERKESASI